MWLCELSDVKNESEWSVWSKVMRSLMSGMIGQVMSK